MFEKGDHTALLNAPVSQKGPGEEELVYLHTYTNLSTISAPRCKSQIPGRRNTSFGYVSSNVLCSSQADLNFLEVKFNNWRRPRVSEKCEKTSEANLCNNEDVMGGPCWSLASGTLWQSENSVKHGIHTQEILNKRDLVFSQASVGISQTLIAHRLIFLVLQLLSENIKFHIKTLKVLCPYCSFWKTMQTCDLLQQLEVFSIVFSLNMLSIRS